MNITIVGAGYVGLVSAVCYATLGHRVLCYDVNEERIQALHGGTSPIHEDGLEDRLNAPEIQRNLTFCSELPEGIECDVAIIAVGTPPMPNGSPNLDNLFKSVEDLVYHLVSGTVLAIKSTVPVGTSKRIERMLSRMSRDDIEVVSFPEFLREGTAISDTLHPTRLVFGVESSAAEQTLRQLNSGIDAPIVVCDKPTAEMIKYSSNAFLATKISFINEIANVCARVGVDVAGVANGMGYDPRIGHDFLGAGIGYGGSCFPKDTRALVKLADDNDYDFRILKSVVEINQRQLSAPIRAVRSWFPDLYEKSIALLGIAFKPGTDDTRESPAIDLAYDLLGNGASIRLCDPVVRGPVDVSGACIEVYDDIYAALSGAHAAILVTAWKEFVNLDWDRVKVVMDEHYLFDGRNAWDPDVVRSHGFVLENVGRGRSQVGR